MGCSFRRFPADVFRVGATVAVVLLVAQQAVATSWYVATNGSNANNGTSSSTPFLTLQYAEGKTNPGDTVYVLPGTYTTSAGNDVVLVTRSETASAPITYTAYSSTRPLLNTSNGWNGFEIDASYITVEGFEIEGDAQSYSSISNPTAYQTNASGITIDNAVSGGAAIPNHLLITNNLVHDNPGSGIEADNADYVTISGNSTYNNANWSGYGQSGISLYELTNSDTTTGTKNYVINNFTYWNQQCVNTTVPPTPNATDGNDVIIDSNLSTAGGHVAYTGRTLVANNITFDNGGAGVSAFDSQHVDIVANTAYQNNNVCANNNGQSQPMKGQIFAYQGTDVNMINNILYSASGPCCSNIQNTSITENYNLVFPSTSVPNGYSLGSHDVFADPKFANASSGNFMISTTSGARGVATSTLEPSTDAYGTSRPQAHGYDIGALESPQ